MKYVFLGLFFSCSIVNAQESVPERETKSVSIPSSFKPSVNYQRYLSAKDKEDIIVKRTKAIMREARRMNRGRGPLKEVYVGNQDPVLTIPVSFERTSQASNNFESNQNAEAAQAGVVSSGNVVCTDLQALTPHVGLQFHGQPLVPKAKAEGACQYEHLFGTPPPYIDFELRQVMLQSKFDENLGDEFFITQYFKTHPKQGLSVRWFQNGASGTLTGTQIFGNCPPAGQIHEFTHNFSIYVFVPSPYVYSGPVPLASAPSIRINSLQC